MVCDPMITLSYAISFPALGLSNTKWKSSHDKNGLSEELRWIRKLLKAYSEEAIWKELTTRTT